MINTFLSYPRIHLSSLFNLQGRRGKGSIYVFSSGNGGGFYGDSCAFNGYVNSIHTIAITGLRSDGSLPVFSEPCAGLMAVTYTRDTIGDSSAVVGY